MDEWRVIKTGSALTNTINIQATIQTGLLITIKLKQIQRGRKLNAQIRESMKMED